MAIATLAELCDRSIGAFQSERATNDTFAYIDVSAIDVSRKKIVNARTVASAEAPSRAQQIVKAGDILVSNVRPNLNAVARVSLDLENAVCSSAFTVLRCTRTLNPDYLFCFVQSPQFVSRLVALAHGAHYPAVTDRQVLAAQIELPSYEEQSIRAKRFLDALSASRTAADACIEQCTLSSMLFERTLTECFQGVTPVSAVASRWRERVGWRWHRLLDLARLESGHTPSRRHPEWWDGDIPWLALPDIRKLHGKHAYETAENTNDAGLANSAARLLPVGTVCLSRTASIGFVTVLGRPIATSQDFANWVCDPDKLDPEFLMYAFMASQDYLRELGSGAVHKTIYMPTIESFHVCAPEIADQQRIARRLRERLGAAESLTACLKTRREDIEQLPQRLLATAFTLPG